MCEFSSPECSEPSRWRESTSDSSGLDDLDLDDLDLLGDLLGDLLPSLLDGDRPDRPRLSVLPLLPLRSPPPPPPSSSPPAAILAYLA